ncbi:MAG: MAPEG family protein [Hyphomonadaceae bacterium]
MYEHGLIAPVLALVLWTLVMWIWLYAMRIPAMQKAKINPQEAERTGGFSLPRAAQRPAENYNHLHEQPTIFYAAALAAQFAGATDDVNIGLAWAYVALRIVHSLIQATVNIIVLRFFVFTLASIALAALTIRTAIAVFS